MHHSLKCRLIKKSRECRLFFLTKSYKYPHNSSPICWNVPHPSPVIWLHGKIVQGLHTQVNTQTITYNGIHDPLHTKVTNTCVTNTCPLVYTAIPWFSWTTPLLYCIHEDEVKIIEAKIFSTSFHQSQYSLLYLLMFYPCYNWFISLLFYHMYFLIQWKCT